MKILFLTNLLPYPLDNGGKIKTYTTLQALAGGGHSIDLLCFTESSERNLEAEAEIKKFCASVHQIPLKLTTAENKGYMIGMAFRSLLSSYSFGLYKYQSKEMYLKLKELLQKSQYDCIYYDHLQLCVYKSYLDKLSPESKSILDEHNCEALIMGRNAGETKNLVKKLFLLLEEKKLRRFEAGQLKSADKSIVLSEEDYAELRKMCGSDFSHEIIPIGVQDRGIKKKASCQDNHLNILFVGTLTWEPNNSGIIWFLKNVIPILNRKKMDYSVYIVGKNPSSELKNIALQYDNVIVTGYVESVEEYYDKCHCMVVPLFVGSGQRVKIIEAFSKGMPVISTSIGAEGLGYIQNENILIADSAAEFAESIETVWQEDIQEKLAHNGRLLYEERYAPAAIERKVLQALRDIEAYVK